MFGSPAASFIDKVLATNDAAAAKAGAIRIYA